MLEKKQNIVTGRAIALSVLVLLLAVSCNTVKYVPENELLLNSVNIQVDNKQVSKEEMGPYLKQRENLRILGFFRFHLWLYNLSSPKKEEGWLKRIGERPQVFNPALARQSQEQLRQFLFNKGYFGAEVEFDALSNEQKRKVDLQFRISTGEPFLIGNIGLSVRDTSLERQIRQEYKPSYFIAGKPFDLDLMDKERDALVRFLRNRGYYNFSKSLVYLEADTIGKGNRVDAILGIELPPESSRDSLSIFQKYRLNRFVYHILPRFQLAATEEPAPPDTFIYDRYTFIFRDNVRFNPRLFERLNRMENSKLFNVGNVENTHTALNRLRQFRYVNIYFQEAGYENDTALLDAYFDIAPLNKQSVSFDLEGTNTSGNLGIGGNVNYNHRNLFRGAEILQLNFKGAMERQQAFISNESRDFNTRETGLEANLIVPGLIGPAGLFPSTGNVLPRTLLTLGYNYQRRPDYTRSISTFRIGYEWMASDYKRHNWNLLDFNMVNLSRFDPDFINSIFDLYIKSSFTDHLIMATNYSYSYNSQVLRTRSNYSFVRFSGESSGNFLYLMSKLTGAKMVTVSDSSSLLPQSFYRFFDTRYAQYVKGDIEYRRGYMIDQYNAIVGRFFVGVGFPYGNFDVLPFEKKYFTGGANGIRAWQVRSLGPGTYRAPAGSYPNQSGDIKIEANFEYRFKLIKYLESALFIDAGNVWAINEKDNRAGAQFKPATFYREFAVGIGTGFRFDFDYFVFRLDMGMKARDPAQPESKGWIIGTRRLTGDDFNFSFAIGYPF